MRKAFFIFKLVPFGLFLLGGLSLSMHISAWLTEGESSRTLISAVYAKQMARTLPSGELKAGEQSAKPPIVQNTFIRRSIQARFKDGYTVLPGLAKKEMEQAVRDFNIAATDKVTIQVGPVSNVSALESPKLAKLRAQNVARIIFPFTQEITINLNPALADGMVVLEFLSLDRAG